MYEYDNSIIFTFVTIFVTILHFNMMATDNIALSDNSYIRG